MVDGESIVGGGHVGSSRRDETRQGRAVAGMVVTGGGELPMGGRCQRTASLGPTRTYRAGARWSRQRRGTRNARRVAGASVRGGRGRGVHPQINMVGAPDAAPQTSEWQKALRLIQRTFIYRSERDGMPTGDDLSAITWLVGLSIAFILAAISQAGWRGKALVSALFVIAAVFLIAGATWFQWKSGAPRLSSYLIETAGSPVSWFSIILFVSGAFLFTLRTGRALEGYIRSLAPEERKVPAKSLPWKHQAVYGASHAAPPRFLCTFARNGENARFYVDYCVYHAALNRAGWTQPIRIELASFAHFSRDQAVTIQLFEKMNVYKNTFWRFAAIYKEEDPNKPQNLINKDQLFRGRITLVIDNRDEYHCYFIGKTSPEADPAPEVTGQHMYDHTWKWEESTEER